MAISGGCYCGAVRFEIDGQVRMRALCLCRTCQKISGGAGNLFIGLQADDFRYTHGEPRYFTRADVAEAPTREFCGECGVHLASRSPKAPGGMIVKVGTLDDPAVFAGPAMVFWAEQKQGFHRLPDDATVFPRLPGR
ncbi:GFA family protein [Dyella silvatica]|uniref:GFA family protein n=1 Tax=Dyella silvatica TaxID=2992128 RepID=UPI002255B219|nr:GFA family protein [Dyella silvatica]